MQMYQRLQKTLGIGTLIRFASGRGTHLECFVRFGQRSLAVETSLGEKRRNRNFWKTGWIRDLSLRRQLKTDCGRTH